MRLSAQDADSRRLTGFVVAVAGIAAVWVLVRTWHGPVVHGDAVTYVNVAENLADGKGLRRYNDVWHSGHPPGWPIVLAGFELAGMSAKAAARWLGPALFAAAILVGGMWLKSVCRTFAAVVVGVLAMGLWPAWHHHASGYYSEPLFLVLVFGALALLSEFLQTPSRRGLWLLLAAAGLAGAAAATRYLGAVVILSGVLVVLGAAPDRRSGGARFVLAGIFGSVASLPLAVVMILNAKHSGHAMGDRSRKGTGNSLLDSIEQLARLQIRAGFVVAWLLLLTAAFLLWMGRSEDRLSAVKLQRTLPFAVFAVVYSAALIPTQGFTNDQIDPRLFLPAGMALLVVACELLDRAVGCVTDSAGARRRIGLVLAGAAALPVMALGHSAWQSLQDTRHALELGAPGGSYSGADAAIRESDVVEHLKEHPIDATVYTNRPNALFWLTDHRSVRWLPTLQGSDCAEWISSVQPSHVVWFADLKPGAAPRCVLPDAEAQLPQLQAVHRSDGGVIYRADSAP